MSYLSLDEVREELKSMRKGVKEASIVAELAMDGLSHLLKEIDEKLGDVIDLSKEGYRR